MSIVKNVVTGVQDIVPDHYLDHPILGKDLTLIEEEIVIQVTKKSKEQPAPEAEPIVAEPETTK